MASSKGRRRGADVRHRKAQTRRANKTGKLYFRPDRSRWIAEATIDGTKHYRSHSDHDEAERMLGQLLRARDASDLSLTSEQPLDRFIVTWLERKLMRGALRPHSFRAYRGLLAHAVHDPALGNMTLGAITPTHIERFIDTCLRGSLSRTTANKLHVVLKAVFGDAVFARVGRTTKLPITDRG